MTLVSKRILILFQTVIPNIGCSLLAIVKIILLLVTIGIALSERTRSRATSSFIIVSVVTISDLTLFIVYLTTCLRLMFISTLEIFLLSSILEMLIFVHEMKIYVITKTAPISFQKLA